MKMPPGYRRNGTILKLNKALYGLRRSLLLWQRELTQTVRKLGFQPIPHEPCCFIQGIFILFFYVDDIFIASRKHQSKKGNRLAFPIHSYLIRSLAWRNQCSHEKPQWKGKNYGCMKVSPKMKASSCTRKRLAPCYNHKTGYRFCCIPISQIHHQSRTGAP
jgi:Reverse transcriptase (RNA-dependent DNA polymerase)